MSSDIGSIPIDIHANKLLDWLLSRHHCTSEWPEKIGIVREKINAALQDMPENDVLRKILAEASPLNYYHCLKIVDVLKQTEVESKNIFGMYGSRRMKDWQDILKLYQKDNLFLAEGASIIGRNVIYEVPALKRLVAKCEQGQAECMKTEQSSKKQAQEYRDKFLSSCSQLGLHLEVADNKPPSVAMIGNLLVSQMSQELPAIFDKISNGARNLQDAVLFYRRFLQETSKLKRPDTESLRLLYSVIEKGNFTTYEWKHGEPPLKIEAPRLDYLFGVEEAINAELDLEIDFADLTVVDDKIELEPGNIDWGDEGAIELLQEEIDFSAESEVAEIVLEETGNQGGLAKDSEALSVLENADIRSEFLDDLFELEGFLAQRIEEVKHEKPNEMTLSYTDDLISSENLETLYKHTNQLLAIFKETKTKQYLLVRESKRYITRLAESLLQNLSLANKLDSQAERAAIQFAQMSADAKQVNPKIQSLIRQTKDLQASICKEISVKYNNRDVYITGGL